MTDVEEIILHQIVDEEALWDTERQKYLYRYWHTVDCLACKLNLPDDGKWQWAGTDWMTK